MNNNPRNDLEFSDSTLLDVMPEKVDEDIATKYVLIKHD